MDAGGYTKLAGQEKATFINMGVPCMLQVAYAVLNDVYSS